MGETEFEIGVAVWTIRLALLCMVAAFAIRLSTKNVGSAALEYAKSLWLLGSLLSLLHALATMGFYHQFQHQLAYEDTARQTEETLGVAVGAGIYFNYVFVLLWLFDAMWWIGFCRSYMLRFGWINRLVYGFLIFIAINGAIVFESGVIRWSGIAALALLATCYFFRGRDMTPKLQNHDES